MHGGRSYPRLREGPPAGFLYLSCFASDGRALLAGALSVTAIHFGLCSVVSCSLLASLSNHMRRRGLNDINEDLDVRRESSQHRKLREWHSLEAVISGVGCDCASSARRPAAVAVLPSLAPSRRSFFGLGNSAYSFSRFSRARTSASPNFA